jgi:periplasmic divalent cation tolerance protein
MEPTALVVLTTLASEAEARRLAATLLQARVIACATILPGGRSLYRWKGDVKEEAEVVVLLKTDPSKWEALVSAVRAAHPYEVPELLALPVERGLESYLSWLKSEVAG